MTDPELREIRDRFDFLTDRLAEPLGPRVGKALLLDGFTYRRARLWRATRGASPLRSNLPA